MNEIKTTFVISRDVLSGYTQIPENTSREMRDVSHVAWIYCVQVKMGDSTGQYTWLNHNEVYGISDRFL